MIDANHAYDVVAAIRLGRLVENLDIGWFEGRFLLRTWPATAR